MKRQRLSFLVETLESRQLLAGQVSATLRGSLLDVVGDAEANDVVIEQQDGQIRILSGKRALNWFERIPGIEMVFLLLILAFWILRNIPSPAFSILRPH